MKLFTPEISWHQKEPIFSVDFCPKSWKLASCGADFTVKIWMVKEKKDDDASIGLEFLANLDRHTKPVNVVRFSPDGKYLASAGDDGTIILWKFNESEKPCAGDLFNDEDILNKESWTVHKMLRGHIEDVYDLAWSPDSTQLISGSVDNSAILWDAVKGQNLKILTDHKHYVQGVSWDPRGFYIATHSSDRSCRLYHAQNHRCLHNIHKNTSSYKQDGNLVKSKLSRMFLDETMQSFFRRCTFSPDGSFLFLPAGICDGEKKSRKTTFVFARGHFKSPIRQLPGPKKPTVAVKCCPIVYELREDKENQHPMKESTEFFNEIAGVRGKKKMSPFVISDVPQEKGTSQDVDVKNQISNSTRSLSHCLNIQPKALQINSTFAIVNKHKNVFIRVPYRMIYAVASLDAVTFYDTQYDHPIGICANMHYASLTDMTWSSDGKLLVISSTDGYCSFVKFDENEFGNPILFDPIEYQVSQAKIRAAALKTKKKEKKDVEKKDKKEMQKKEKLEDSVPKEQQNGTVENKEKSVETKEKKSIDRNQPTIEKLFVTPVRKRKRPSESSPIVDAKRTASTVSNTVQATSSSSSSSSPSTSANPVEEIKTPTCIDSFAFISKSPSKVAPPVKSCSPVKAPKRVTVTTLKTFTPNETSAAASTTTATPSILSPPKPPKRVAVTTLSTNVEKKAPKRAVVTTLSNNIETNVEENEPIEKPSKRISITTLSYAADNQTTKSTENNLSSQGPHDKKASSTDGKSDEKKTPTRTKSIKSLFSKSPTVHSTQSSSDVKQPKRIQVTTLSTFDDQLKGGNTKEHTKTDEKKTDTIIID